jgi:mono/diheme cytochrome c family protein
MRRTALGFIALSLFASTSAPAAESFSDYSGEELYQRFCASCHGDDGYGDGPVAASLKVTIPDLTRMYQRHGGRFPEQKIREIIDGRQVIPVHGSRFMPVWGQQFFVGEGADQQAEARLNRIVDKLVDYIRSIQQ